MQWSGTGSWVKGHAGHGSAEWWVTWVMGHKMWPIVSSGLRCYIVTLLHVRSVL